MNRCPGAVCILLFFCLELSAQRPRMPENLPTYYKERWQFGFSPGVNRLNFVVTFAGDHSQPDSLKSVLSRPESGLHLFLLAERRLHPYLTLRCEPGFLLGQRVLDYFFVTPNRAYEITQKVESNLLFLPLTLRLRSKRVVNFAANMGAGAYYAYDVASQRDVNTNLQGQQIVKLQRDDFGIQAESGFDFFFPYFKMGLELHMKFGLRNLLVPDGTIYSGALKSLRSQMLLFTLHLEG